MKSAAKPKRIQWGKPIRVTPCNNRGCQTWVVSWYDELGRRQRLARASENAAREEAEAIAERLRRGQPVEVTLTLSDRQVLQRAKEVLEPQGVALDHAMATLASALKHVDIHMLVEATRWFALNRPATGAPKTTQEILDELLEAKKDRAPRTVGDLRVRLTAFAKAFQCPLSAVDGAQIEKYVQGLPVSARTKRNTLNTVGTLLNFARRKRYIPQNHAGIKEVEPIRVAPPEIGIFTPEEMAMLLRKAPPSLVAPLAISAFCGLRTAEIARLDWSEVHLDRGFIEVRAANAKTRVRRLPKIGATLRAWLEPVQQKVGPITRYKNHVNAFLKLAKRCKVQWKQNALRHSFISYQVAQCEDVAAVALHCGNSPGVINRSYLQHVAPEEAAKWFSLTPATIAESAE